MDLRQKMDRFYLDLVLNELRLANSSQLGHLTYNSILYLDIIAYQENCRISSASTIAGRAGWNTLWATMRSPMWRQVT